MRTLNNNNLEITEGTFQSDSWTMLSSPSVTPEMDDNMKMEIIKDFNGIAINDKPIKASKIEVSITIHYEGKYGEEQYGLDSFTLDDCPDVVEHTEELVDVDWEGN